MSDKYCLYEFRSGALREGEKCGDRPRDNEFLHKPTPVNCQAARNAPNCMHHTPIYEPEAMTVNIEPSTGGYANIAVTFASSIMSDVRLHRRAAVAEQLGQLVRIAGYLGQKDPGALLDLQSSVEAL